MPEYELLQTINELRPHCFFSYFSSGFGIMSILIGLFLGIYGVFGRHK